MMDSIGLWFKRKFAAAVGSRNKSDSDSNRAVFSNVYKNKLWGMASPENESPFYSGPGSSDPQIII